MVVTITHWSPNPEKQSTDKILYIVYGHGKQEKQLTITNWKVKGSHIRGKVIIQGKKPQSNDAYLTWGGRKPPSRIKPINYGLVEYQCTEFCRQQSDYAYMQKVRQQKEGHLFNSDAESRVELTVGMVLNPDNYGDAYVPPKC